MHKKTTYFHKNILVLVWSTVSAPHSSFCQCHWVFTAQAERDVELLVISVTVQDSQVFCGVQVC